VNLVSTVLQIRSNGQITLPTSVRRQARLKEGDLLEVLVEEDGSLRLVPKIAIDRSQAYFWTHQWQQGEREAEEDLRSGRFKDFASMDELVEDLGSEE
jgi:AbrB family looped-hinge helix DNA binding protein